MKVFGFNGVSSSAGQVFFRGCRPRRHRSPLRRCGVVFGIWGCFLGLASGEPYPKDGKVIKWTQPDGSALTLRVFGDEFYARTATETGYTVIFDAARKAYFYAKFGNDGESLVPSNVPAELAPPEGLPKDLRESKQVVAKIRAKNTETYGSGASEDWNARKQAWRERRAKAAGSATPAAHP